MSVHEEAGGGTSRDRRKQRGHLRFDRRFAAIGVERLQRSSGTSDPAEFRRLNLLLTELAAHPDGVPIVQAFARDVISPEELQIAGTPAGRGLMADRCRALLAGALMEVGGASRAAPHDVAPSEEPLGGVAARIHTDNADPVDIISHIIGPRPTDLELVNRQLWLTALDELIPAMDIKDVSKRRYATSTRALRSKAQALAMSEESYEVLAGLSEQQWKILETFRTRGVSVVELVELVSMRPMVRGQYLRQRGVRIGTEYVNGLTVATREQWDALEDAGDLPVGARHFEALDRLTRDERAQLRRIVHHLRPDAPVADLVRIKATDWRLLSRAWGNSAADWNHVRRALAAVLTTLCHGDPRHPVRQHVIDAIPLLPEVERVPQISPATFWRILEHLPGYARRFPLFLVVSGLRVGEYERLERPHLHPDTFTIDVPGTKTSTSEETISISSDCWQFVEDAVPSPFRYGWMRRLFREACNAVGVHGVTLHDLRHCHGQWALESGAEEHEVQAQLRHRSIATTRRYVKTLQKRRSAEAAARHLLDARPDP